MFNSNSTAIIITDELLDDTLEEITKALEAHGDYKKAFKRGVNYVKIKSYNTNDKKIGEFLIKHLTKKPSRKEGEGLHDFGTRVLEWKKGNESFNDFIRIIQEKKPNLFLRLKEQQIFKDDQYLIIALLSIWIFVHFLFCMNDTYTITNQGYTYLNKANSHIYNEYLYKLPKEGTYSSDLVAHTRKSYFGVFPDWTMNIIYFGYLVIILYAINLESNKKNRQRTTL